MTSTMGKHTALSLFSPPNQTASLRWPCLAQQNKSRMCTIVNLDDVACPVQGSPGMHILFLNPIGQEVRSITGMGLRPSANPNSSTCRSVQLLWWFMITSSCLTTRYGSGIQYSQPLTFGAFSQKIRYVWKGRKSWSPSYHSCKVHWWLTNERTDSILLIHPGAFRITTPFRRFLTPQLTVPHCSHLVPILACFGYLQRSASVGFPVFEYSC